MKKKMMCSIFIMTLGLVSLSFFSEYSRMINENAGDHPHASMDFSLKLRSEELKIEALKKAGLRKIRAEESGKGAETD